MLILSTGGKGTGVEAEGSNFPFVQPSSDIQGLLADLWVAHDIHEVVQPLRVQTMSGFQEAFDGLPSAAQIQIVDANDLMVFDSAGANYHWKPWGNRLRIHEWLFVNGSVCRAVQHCAVPEPRDAWPSEITPVNGTLDERASELLPLRLLSLSDTHGQTIPSGEVTFINGWNVNISAAPYREPLRNTTALTFSANPGDGPGRKPGCEAPDIVIRRIGGVGPDNQGNFSLAAGKCFFVRQPITIGADKLARPTYEVDPVNHPERLVLGNDCGPCCDCDSYVNVQQAILNLEAKIRATAAQAEATRDEYVASVARWNDQKACREDQALQIAIIGTNNTYVDISTSMCNTEDTCLTDTTHEVTITTTPPVKLCAVPGTTYKSQANGQLGQYVPTGDPCGGSFVFHFDAINPAAAGKTRMRFKSGPQYLARAVISVKVAHKFPPPKPPVIKTSYHTFWIK